MALIITEDEVSQLLSMEETIGAVETAFRELGSGKTSNLPRRRMRFKEGMLHIMAAALPAINRMGLKSYTTVAGQTRSHVLLYDSNNGSLLAVIEADKLGQLRTGAASAVATKYMARSSAKTLGIIGAGTQARTQLIGICSVRRVTKVKVYSRNADNLQKFCEKMTQVMGTRMSPVKSALDAIEDADIVVTATTSKDPVLLGEWLKTGMHLNIIGSNYPTRREVDDGAILRADRIAVDSKDQAKIESGDLLPVIQKGLLSWDTVHELGEIVAGKFAGRENDQEITLFKSHGLAIEDIVVADIVYRNAIREGFGREVPV